MPLIALLILLGSPEFLAAQSQETAIRAVLDEQVRAWNQGDLSAFVRTYSAETVFVGKEVTRGNAGLLERYKRNYPTREKMGTLKFTDIEVRLLGGDFASALGRFHLERAAAGGGNVHGIFTLLLKRSGKAWTIILDHTS
ncbi:MAG TPA: nuclear transport factor 2 family protein [Bryobacteraceae bacterium]|nr:nuclear transport factor 2 family protein [Bryobacteraceae bacterium]